MDGIAVDRAVHVFAVVIWIGAYVIALSTVKPAGTPKVLICRTGCPFSKAHVFLGFARFGLVFRSNFTLAIL